MSELYLNFNRKILEQVRALRQKGVREIALQGGRRSGKTFFVCQAMINKTYKGDIVNMAAMTGEQGRLGAYSDCKTIIAGSPSIEPDMRILSTPREIQNATYGGRMFFNSYQDPERAKGIACDHLYINEANNFTRQQYMDLAASVRQTIFIDYNPNIHFWVEEVFDPDCVIRTTWKDNAEYLTPLQLKYFEDLYKNAHRDGATAMDMYLYKVYYLGEYAELVGSIFTPANIQVCEQNDLPDHFDRIVLFSDPSARMNADYHASVMAGISVERGKIYILDTDSRNIGTDYEMAMMLKEWMCRYDGIAPYIETNGAIGEQFFQYCRRSNIQVLPFNSKSNKIERILSNYQTICQNVVFLNTDHLKPFLEQVYTFDGYEKKCEHDDNIDAVNSAVTLLKPYLR